MLKSPTFVLTQTLKKKTTLRYESGWQEITIIFVKRLKKSSEPANITNNKNIKK